MESSVVRIPSTELSMMFSRNSLVSRSSLSRLLLTVMSRMISTKPTAFPEAGSMMAVTVVRAGNRSPIFLTRDISSSHTPSARVRLDINSWTPLCRSSGRIVIPIFSRPTTSSFLYPKSFSAPLLNSMIFPWKSRAMMPYSVALSRMLLRKRDSSRYFSRDSLSSWVRASTIFSRLEV